MKTFHFSVKLLLIALFAALFSLTSCEGPEGPIGPQGPEGPAGQAGATGPAGADGADGATGATGATGQQGASGQNGNANVKSYTFTVGNSDYSADNKVTLDVPAITQDIVDNGVVLVYWQSSDGWRLLPFTFITSSGLTTRTLMSNYSLAQVVLQLRTIPVDNTFKYTGTFRIVVIEGNAGKKGYDVDFSDYEAVINYFGLSLDPWEGN
ncbi:MAG: hypothetical protein AAF587_10345 [Bacteroidota bacterium]